MIKLITFDLDNTLWEVMPVIVKAEREMRSWLQERVPDYSDIVSGDLMTTLRNEAIDRDPQLIYNISDLRVLLLTQALGHCGLTSTTAQTLAQDAFAVFMRGRNNVEFYPEALPALNQLSNNYRLGALTNGNADITDMPISELFEFSISPEKVQSRKPEPQIFNAVLAQSGCQPHEIVHVGDHLHEDVGGAIAAGWHAVWANLADEDEPPQPNYSAAITRLSDLPSVIDELHAQAKANARSD